MHIRSTYNILDRDVYTTDMHTKIYMFFRYIIEQYQHIPKSTYVGCISRSIDILPIGSMYGIFTYIYHKNQPNVSIYSSPMDPLGYIYIYT